MTHTKPSQSGASPVAALKQQARAFYGLTVADNITQAFNTYRDLLQETIALTADPTPFAHAWHWITNDAAVALIDFEQGDSMALVKLQHMVGASAELLPESPSAT